MVPRRHISDPAAAGSRRRRLAAYAASLAALAVWLSVARAERSPAPALPRSTVDRVDASAARQVHLVYAVPADGDDRALDVSGAINASVASANRWLASQTGGRALRIDTYRELADVTFVRLPRTDASYAAHGAQATTAIAADLDARGFTKPSTIYVVYYDGTSPWACGSAAWPPSVPGHDAVLYLDGAPRDAPACSTVALGAADAEPGYWEYALLHEVLHTVGLVPLCAPHEWRSGHVPEPRDLMYRGDAEWGPFPLTLDIGRDDYYGTRPDGCGSLDGSGLLTGEG